MGDFHKALLIGVLVDVSGSMRGSIGSSGIEAINRLEAFNLAFEDLIKEAADFQKTKSSNPKEIEVKIFAYGFGFNNPISSFLGRSGPDVRDLFAPQGRGEATVDASNLADNWEKYSSNIKSMSYEMFGGTPMRSALEMARDRIFREYGNKINSSVLFILSDGEPTDDRDGNILSISREIQYFGTTIISCFVTESDVVEPQCLYTRPMEHWPAAANLMFQCASPIVPGSSFEIHLREHDWQFEQGSRLFSQINQSSMLGNFLSIVLSPLTNENAHAPNEGRRIGSKINNQGPPASISSAERSQNLDNAFSQIVIMVHGIRTFALWQSEVRKVLEESGFGVEPTNYGRFDLVRFLLPVPWFRSAAAAVVLRQIKIVMANNRNAEISIIAHSFGTYVVSKLLKENFDLDISRVIFCGSVVDYGFRFEDFQNRFRQPILNEVGSRDPFPALAESVTWGYGSAGTYGFNRPLVRDRWHNNAGHSYFLNKDFCKEFWLPFLKSGVIVAGVDNPDHPSIWVRLISIFKLKWIMTAVLIFFGAYEFEFDNNYTSACLGLPGNTAWIVVGQFFADTGKFAESPNIDLVDQEKRLENISVGDRIEIKNPIPTKIVDYSKNGTARSYDSPFADGGYRAENTCKILHNGDKYTIKDVKKNGPAGANYKYIWARIEYH